MKPATRMDRIGTETAFEAAARARALEATGREVIHLEIGEPDFDTPRNVSEAAADALLERGETHYTAATGIAPLREAIVADVERWKGIRATPDQVIVTPGAKPIMFFTMLALVNDGRRGHLPEPRVPDLRVDGPLRRRHAGRRAAARGERLSAWTSTRSPR